MVLDLVYGKVLRRISVDISLNIIAHIVAREVDYIYTTNPELTITSLSIGVSFFF